MTTPNPPYIARGGDLIMSQPLALERCTMYSFLIHADRGALGRLLDAQLNVVTAPSTIYRPLLPMATIVCADIVKSYSRTPPDSDKGWMAERDFGVWIPVAAGHLDRHGEFVVDRLVWYLPYVFVDNVAAMVTGRDEFGFWKQTATLAMPTGPGEPGAFTVDALAIPRFSPTTEAEVTRLLTVAPRADASTSALSTWSGAVDAGIHLLGEMRRFFEIDVAHGLSGLLADWELVKTLFDDAITGAVPMVFLRQLRDITDPRLACYQAVVEAPAKMQRWHGGGLMGPHDVTLVACDSHPIARDLGLAPGTISADVGFWTQLDFDMDAGRVIAERGGGG